MNQPNKTDERAAERVLKRAVAVARAYLGVATTDEHYARITEANAIRFTHAIIAAEIMLDDPTVEAIA